MIKKRRCHIYLRASTLETDLVRHEDIINNAKRGYEILKIYQENLSKRSELKKLLRNLKINDVVIIEKMDMLTRMPLLQLNEFIKCAVSKNINLYISNSELFSNSFFESPLQQDIAEFIQELVQTLLRSILLEQAKNHYEYIKHRQTEGIKIAKRQNKYSGRKKNQQLHDAIVNCRFNQRMTIRETAEICKCSTTTVKNVSKKYLQKYLPK